MDKCMLMLLVAAMGIGSMMAYNPADYKKAKSGIKNLANADLANAYFFEADLTKTDLSHADLTGAYLVDADLSNANLGYAKLANANLRRAFLTNAVFYYADLTSANLIEAHLTGADLSCADLTGALLEQGVFDETICNVHTKFPSGYVCIDHKVIHQ